MTPRDRLLALLVAVIWGLNFTAIHATLEQFPPFFAVAVRFTLLAVPTILLVPRPAVPVRWLVGYGLGFGTLQFAFLYLAMAVGMPAGLASLVLQSSAPFTVLLAALLLHERLGAGQVAGIALAAGGLAGIGLARAGQGGGAAALPVLLTVLGGLGWALGNLSSRLARPDSPLRLTLWMSVVPPLPMLALSLVADGPAAIGTSLTTLGTRTGALALVGLAFTVLVATVLGSGIWTTLLSRYPSSTVAPFSMLVPVAGFTAAWLLLGERPSGAELACGALVLGGVLLAGAMAGRARSAALSPAAPREPSRTPRDPRPVP
jgi:O-acetylserine/cysteine efflux transporter